MVCKAHLCFNTVVEGEDYVAGPHTVSFDDLGVALPTQECTTIVTIDDANVEGPHQFTVEIMSVSLPTSVTIESPSQQTANINDNDGRFKDNRYQQICT